MGVNQLPDDFTNGTVTLNVSTSHNFSDTVIINATLTDKLGNYTNIIGECNTTIYYPNSSVFEENQSLTYVTGSYGVYSYNTTVPEVKESTQ